jgi:hypothetical protein
LLAAAEVSRRSLVWLFAGATAILALLVTVLAGEFLLRAVGYSPWQTFDAALAAADEPVIHAPDAELGWINKPGRYQMPAYGPAAATGARIKTTIWANGARATAEQPRSRASRVVFCGGSFTQGFAIPDAATFAYRLQQRMPEREIVNMGTAGYGTYQCLLLLRRYLADTGHADAVVYGFYDHHEGRNVAAAHWLRSMAMTARRGLINLPYCDIENEQLSCGRAADGYPSWPGRSHSALVTFLQDRWAESRAYERYGRRAEVTFQLLREIRDLTESQGGAFLTVVLQAEPESRDGLLARWRGEGAPFVDCTHEGFGRPAWSVPVDGHPNGRLNAAWADCIEAPLRELLAAP